MLDALIGVTDLQDMLLPWRSLFAIGDPFGRRDFDNDYADAKQH